MLLVVGLGNPGREYDRSRHNVGFEVIEILGERHRFPEARSEKGALVAKGRIRDADVLLVRPTTYMNLSGDAVGAIARFYKVEPAEVVVAHDELDFELGQVRVKIGGGHGGHNGVRSVIAHLGRDFTRVRIGVGKPPAGVEGADWVLSKVDQSTRRILDEAAARAADAVESVLGDGVQKAMNLFNRREELPPE